MFAKNMKYVLLLVILASVAFAAEPDQKEAESVALRFSEALSQFDSKTMLQLAHPEIVAFIHGMMLHIIDTQRDPADTAAFLSAMHVKDIKELESMDRRDVTARFYDMLMANTSAEFKEASRRSKVSVIGSVQEGDIVDVITRTSAPVEGTVFQVPSLVIVKKEAGAWLVLTTTQFESMKANARAKGINKE